MNPWKKYSFIVFVALCLAGLFANLASLVAVAAISTQLVRIAAQQENPRHFARKRSVISATPQQQTRFPPPNLRFERITREDGLSSNTVRTILQDSLGFVWIGTQDGLNRYDGYSFVVYRHDPDDPLSLRDDFIESMYEDRSGVLWVGTQDGWLERYDPQNDQFAHYHVGSHVFAMYEDTAGAFWIGTKDPGLLRFDRDTGELTLIWSGKDFTSVIEDQSGIVWAASPEEGVGRYDRANDRFAVLDINHPTHVIVEDQAGEVWIGTEGGGLGRFDRDTEQFVHLRQRCERPKQLEQRLYQFDV